MTEAALATRTAKLSEVFDEFFEGNCSEKGDQELNLGDGAKKGMKSLSRRVKDGELAILETDKTGKSAACSTSALLKWGISTPGRTRRSPGKRLRPSRPN